MFASSETLASLSPRLPYIFILLKKGYKMSGTAGPGKKLKSTITIFTTSLCQSGWQCSSSVGQLCMYSTASAQPLQEKKTLFLSIH